MAGETNQTAVDKGGSPPPPPQQPWHIVAWSRLRPRLAFWVKSIPTALSVLICGAGIGILVGLSVTPVVGSVVTTLVGLAAGILSLSNSATFVWDRNGQKQQYSISVQSDVQLSVAFFVIGLVAGALSGIYMRNFNVLGSPPPAGNQTAAFIPFLQNRFLPQSDPTPSEPRSPLYQGQTVLFGDSFGGCAGKAGALPDAELRERLALVSPVLGAVIQRRPGAQLNRKQLVTLFEAFVCVGVPLSPGDASRIGRNRQLFILHPHPVVSKLGRDLEDDDLLHEVLDTLVARP